MTQKDDSEKPHALAGGDTRQERAAAAQPVRLDGLSAEPRGRSSAAATSTRWPSRWASTDAISASWPCWARSKPLSQVEMGERLGIDRNTMVLLLDDLEARGLVTRRRDPRDRRAHLVSLTDAGRDVLAQSTALARRTNDEVFAPLSAEERAQLHALLSRLF